ncbi:CDP-alcohol phosphatidyltransferase-domain-containing protein [Thamnocephalis sphaerospora]|uniref:CDP-alcohol phosphatidyltransferase-domain-containing protein n=1 Tax=Thamnocephalis sphaerospora TaxID=78915 RepID=A0A4P9XHA4_9FUNG|nr:CDP-alcohol phosphatidyltransferase-domain-containing protein [Thamnocephalis sphaerospora]|eukprot:RKP05043.1 CDP-alcohol phosphatidyltransferase-domain-containing protein [Thamnocephalis sphaerospora]
MAYVTEEQLQNLSQYKYSSVDKSPVSKYILQPYWTRLVELFPLWMAPNLITLLGFSCILVNLATVLIYDYDLSGECPRWAYFTFALGFFIYQSFDAIDGKQARRTGTSGPLGELFDHGCDALNTSLGAIVVAETLQLRQSWWTALSLFTAMCNFYLSTWEEYHTGTLFLGYFSGPVEGVIVIVLVMLATGVVGPSVWLLPFKETFGLTNISNDIIPEIQLNHAIIIVTFVALLYNIISSIKNVVDVKSTSWRQLGLALAGLLPFFVSSALAYIWLLASPVLLTQHQVAFILYTGVTSSYIVGRIILAHVTKSEFPFFNIVYVPLLIGTVNACVPAVLGYDPLIPLEYETTYLYASLGLVVAIYSHLAFSIIRAFCRHLDIYCLSIKHQQTLKQN